jgi:hypothetical protein
MLCHCQWAFSRHLWIVSVVKPIQRNHSSGTWTWMYTGKISLCCPYAGECRAFETGLIQYLHLTSSRIIHCGVQSSTRSIKVYKCRTIRKLDGISSEVWKGVLAHFLYLVQVSTVFGLPINRRETCVEHCQWKIRQCRGVSKGGKNVMHINLVQVCRLRSTGRNQETRFDQKISSCSRAAYSN